MRTTPAFGHVDADCFYVSAERVRNAFLVGKPVGVLGNQGACVIARSYEMKKAGVPVGMPIWEALRVCLQGIYLKRDFRWYEVLSRLMLEAVRQFSPLGSSFTVWTKVLSRPSPSAA
jgi:nucleotidyltransferase/DNA polymerase involved in DNA repair